MLIGPYTPNEEQLYFLPETDWDHVERPVYTDMFADKNDYLYAENWDRDTRGFKRPPMRKLIQSMERHMPGCMHPLPSEGRPDHFERDRYPIRFNKYLNCYTDDFYGALGLEFKPITYGGDNQDVQRAHRCFVRQFHPDRKAERINQRNVR